MAIKEIINAFYTLASLKKQKFPYSVEFDTISCLEHGSVSFINKFHLNNNILITPCKTLSQMPSENGC